MRGILFRARSSLRLCCSDTFLGRMKLDGWSDYEIGEHALVVCRKAMSHEQALGYLHEVRVEKWARLHADAMGYDIPISAPLPDVPPRPPVKDATGTNGK